MKKLLFFFLVGILFSLSSCKKSEQACPDPPIEKGWGTVFLSTTGAQNKYTFYVFYEDPKPTPGSYFDVMVTPEGQAPKTYKAYNDGLPHTIADNTLGTASVEISVPITSKTFTVIRTAQLPPALQPFCSGGVPSQPMTYANAGK